MWGNGGIGTNLRTRSIRVFSIALLPLYSLGSSPVQFIRRLAHSKAGLDAVELRNISSFPEIILAFVAIEVLAMKSKDF
jgi:hypothetical protein